MWDPVLGGFDIDDSYLGLHSTESSVCLKLVQPHEVEGPRVTGREYLSPITCPFTVTSPDPEPDKAIWIHGSAEVPVHHSAVEPTDCVLITQGYRGCRLICFLTSKQEDLIRCVDALTNQLELLGSKCNAF